MTSRWRLTRMRGGGGEGRLALDTPVHVTVDVPSRPRPQTLRLRLRLPGATRTIDLSGRMGKLDFVFIDTVVDALVKAGCRILGEKKKFTKGMVTFVFTVPARLDREELEEYFLKSVPDEIRGAVDWDIA